MRRLRVGLASVFVVLTCTTGLVVGTAVPAAALIDIKLDDVKDAAKGDYKKGAKIGFKGVSMFGRWSNPFGWAVTAGQVAWWAFDDEDSTFEFEEPDKDLDDYFGPRPGSGGAQQQVRWANSSIEATLQTYTSDTLTFEVYALACPNGCGSFAVTQSFRSGTQGATTPSSQVMCKTSSGNVVTRAEIPTSGRAEVTLGRTSSGGTRRTTVQLKPCLPGESVEGVRYGAPTNSPSVVIEWTRTNEAWPDGKVTFGGVDVQVRCRNAATDEEATISQSSETGTNNLAVMPSCKQHLGDDWYGTGVTIAPTKPEVEGEPLPEEWDVPDFIPAEWDEELPNEESQPCQRSKEGCKLAVWIDNNPCTVGDTKCAEWDEIEKDQPTRVRCMWGRKRVPIGSCRPLIDFYKGGKTRVETPVVKDPVKDPDDTGTGNPAPKPPKDPEEAERQAECFPTGWGMLNPFEWVFKPVRCALVWAFKPRTPISTRITTIRNLLREKAPFKQVISLTGLPTNISGGGCPTSWSFRYQGRTYPLICGTAVEPFVRGLRPAMLVLSVGAAAYPFIRGLVYSSTPVVKPTPS